MIDCSQCGKGFDPKPFQIYKAKNAARVYCDPKCRWEYVSQLSRVRMANTNRKYASVRMKANNPMASVASVAKMTATMKRLGHKPKVRGGNGQPTPVPVARLAESLGWPLEVAVKTGCPRGQGFPTVYKLDIGNRELKIGVEVDGNSHNIKRRKEEDSKKTALLSSLGWIVLRFSNQAVMERLEECVQVVESTISKLKANTPTLQTAS